MNTRLRARQIAALFVFALLLSACNLTQLEPLFGSSPAEARSGDSGSGGESVVIAPTTEPSPTPESTAANATSTPPSSGDSDTDRDVADFVLPNCIVQHPDWPIYIVKAGDTLAKIANKVGSSVNVLAQVNCLVDANLIYVGQHLRVPLTFVPEEPVEPIPQIPLIDIGIQPPEVCVVRPTGTQASIWGAGVPDGPAAILMGRVRFVRHADNAFIVELPPGGVQGWVSAMEARLEGTGCPPAGDTNPNFPPNLPVIIIGDAPPASLCAVVKDASPGTRYIYGGASAAHAPIAIMGDYLPFVAFASSGYEVGLPGWDMNGWVPANGVHLSGSTCP